MRFGPGRPGIGRGRVPGRMGSGPGTGAGSEPGRIPGGTGGSVGLGGGRLGMLVGTGEGMGCGTIIGGGTTGVTDEGENCEDSDRSEECD